MAEVEAKAIFIEHVPAVFSYARDPKDEGYVNLAIAAGARGLVTWDRDLLDLMNPQTAAGKEFRQQFPGLSIMEPPAFLRDYSPKAGNVPA